MKPEREKIDTFFLTPTIYYLILVLFEYSKLKVMSAVNFGSKSDFERSKLEIRCSIYIKKSNTL